MFVNSPAFPIPTVLLVDTDPSALARYGKLLSDAGFRVVTAASFDEASARLRLVKADAIVSDIRLGAYNGLHVLLRAREEFAPRVAIVIDAIDDPVLRAEAEALDAIYLVKPVDDAALLARLREKFDVKRPA